MRGRRPARRNSAPKIVLQISLARQAASADDFCAKDNLTARKMQYRLTREMIGSLYLLMRCAPVREKLLQPNLRQRMMQRLFQNREGDRRHVGPGLGCAQQMAR